MVCILPTQGIINQPIEVFIKGQDQWGNPTAIPKDVSLEWQGNCQANIKGNVLTTPSSGHGRVAAKWNGQLFYSNPVTIYEHEPRYKKYWGDLHAQSASTIGTGDEIEYFTFGRDVARLDFISHQGNDFQVTNENWTHLNQVIHHFNEDDHFVIFPGYEWSANTPTGGDLNIFYSEEGLPIFRSSHWQIPQVLENELSPAHPASILFYRLKEYINPSKILIAAHVGGRYANLRGYFDQELIHLVEVVSCWGVFEWLLWEALEKGYKVGIVCNSDGHKGRPGAEFPGVGEFGIRGGLTCILGEKLTRKELFKSLKNRYCYGTTGPRIDLSFEVNGQPMGACIQSSAPIQIQASVKGTAPLDSRLVYQGKKIIRAVRSKDFTNCSNSKRIRLWWGGSRIRGRGRRVTWDGIIHVENACIISAETVSFDSLTDGILEMDRHQLRFRSRTTGDIDGIDILLNQPYPGTVILETPVGKVESNLNQLDVNGEFKELGGVDMRAGICRYPEKLTDLELSIKETLLPEKNKVTPFFVKAVQSDGHMAWSSPIYVDSV